MSASQPCLTSLINTYAKVNHALRLLDEFCIKEWDITGIQAIILNCLLQGIDRPHLISEKLEGTSQTMTGVLDRLEKKDIVERRRDIADRRGVRLVPTQEALATIRSSERFTKRLEELTKKAKWEADL